MTEQTDEAHWGKPLRAGMAVFVFLLVLAMFPYTQDPAGDIKTLIGAWAALLLGVGWVVSAWLNRQPFRRPQIMLEVLLLFLALHLLSALLGAHRGHSFAELGDFWSLFVIYLVASQIYRTPDQVRRLMLVLCIAVAVSSLYAILVQHFGLDPFPWRTRTSDEYVNLPGTFGNPNYAAHTLILAVIMAIFLATRISMAWCVGFAALFLVHLHFTHQRAGIIALAAAAALMLVAWAVSKVVRRPVAATVSTLAVVGVLAIAGIVAIMGVSKMRTGSVYPLDLSLLIRYKSYCSAARMILTRPMIGYGPGSYVIEYPRFWTPYEQQWFADELKMNAHVHNDLLETAANAGLPAAGLYLVLLVLGVSYGLLIGFTREHPQQRRLGFALAALFTAFAVDGLFGFNLHVPVSAAILFLMMGILEGAWLSGAPAVALASPRYGFAWKTPLIVTTVATALLAGAIFLSQAFLLRGEAELHWQRYDRAERILGWGENLAPWNWEFPRQRGIASLAKEGYPAAIWHLERAIQDNPQFVTTWVPLARAKLGAVLGGNPAEQKPLVQCLQVLDDAALDAQQILRLCPMFPTGEELLGRVALGRAMLLSKDAEVKAANAEKIKNSWQEAETHFSKAIQYGAKSTSELYRQLVQVRTALGDTKGAEQAMIRATQADPSDELNWPFFYSFARTNKMYDRFRELLEWRIERLSEKTPPDTVNLSTAYLWLASIDQEGRNDLDAAEASYQRAVKTAPARPAIWTAYAQFAQTTGRLDSFKKFLVDTNSEILASGKPPLPQLVALARVWKEGPDALVEATAYLVGVIQGSVKTPDLKPSDLDMKWAISLLLETARDPNTPPAVAGLAMLHLGMVATGIGEMDLATKIYPSAIPNLKPDLQGVCAQHWADALVKLKRASEAVNLLRDQLEQHPENRDLRLSLARCLVKNNNNIEAIGEYQALLDNPDLKPEERATIQAERAKVAADSESKS